MVNIEKGTRFTIPSTIKEMFDMYCKNIIPYMYLYKYQVEYYEKTVYEILEKDIGLICLNLKIKKRILKTEMPEKTNNISFN